MHFAYSKVEPIEGNTGKVNKIKLCRKNIGNRKDVKLVMFIKYKKHFVIVKTNKSYVLVSLTITKLVYEIFVFHENEKSTLLQ